MALRLSPKEMFSGAANSSFSEVGRTSETAFLIIIIWNIVVIGGNLSSFFFCCRDIQTQNTILNNSSSVAVSINFCAAHLAAAGHDLVIVHQKIFKRSNGWQRFPNIVRDKLRIQLWSGKAFDFQRFQRSFRFRRTHQAISGFQQCKGQTSRCRNQSKLFSRS